MNPVKKLQLKYKVPLAHIARATGYSVRQVYRHRYDEGPMRETVLQMYAEKYRTWGWEGSGFFPTRYHHRNAHGETETEAL